MKPVIFLSLIALVFFSCKKENSPSATINYTFPTTLKLAGVTKNSDVVVYTKDGQVTDKNVINRFALTQNFNDTTYHSVFNKISININDYKAYIYDTIKFLSRDTLLWGNTQTDNSMWDPVQKYSVVQSGERFLLYSKYQYTLSSSDISLSTLFKYNDPKMSSINIGWGYLSRRTSVATGNYNQISISVMCYKFERINNVYGYLYEQNPVFNEFNPDFIKTLVAGDTVAVQSYSFIYKKIN